MKALTCYPCSGCPRPHGHEGVFPRSAQQHHMRPPHEQTNDAAAPAALGRPTRPPPACRCPRQHQPERLFRLPVAAIANPHPGDWAALLPRQTCRQRPPPGRPNLALLPQARCGGAGIRRSARPCRPCHKQLGPQLRHRLKARMAVLTRMGQGSLRSNRAQALGMPCESPSDAQE